MNVDLSFKGKKLRTYKNADGVWCCGKDICNILDYKNAKAAISNHVDVAHMLSVQNTRMVNEHGLAQLLDRCNIPDVNEFIDFCNTHFNIKIHKFLNEETKEAVSSQDYSFKVLNVCEEFNFDVMINELDRIAYIPDHDESDPYESDADDAEFDVFTF